MGATREPTTILTHRVRTAAIVCNDGTENIEDGLAAGNGGRGERFLSRNANVQMRMPCAETLWLSYLEPINLARFRLGESVTPAPSFLTPINPASALQRGSLESDQAQNLQPLISQRLSNASSRCAHLPVTMENENVWQARQG
jgi:hypothetical protein